MLQKKHRVHFVGIGGIGMSGIAEVLLNLGYVVSGSDLHETEATRRLRSLGAQVFVGHQEENLSAHPSVVVISTAVKYSNPEVLEARRRQIPVIPRAEMLAELMRMKYGVAVAGSHGKTTTTSMIAAVLSASGLDPTMVIGGRVRMLGTNAKMGQGEILVAEADESDGSFLLLSPTIAVVTNIDREHMDFHETMERLNESFLDFINKIPFYGLAVLCLDNANVHALLPKVRKRFATYGAIRDSWKRPLIVIFQPHRFSRTRDLFDEFLTAFEGADRLILTDIYAAGEDPMEGVSSEALYQAIKRKGHMEVQFIPDKDQLVKQLAGKLNPGDIALTLGAGDIYKVGDAIVEALK